MNCESCLIRSFHLPEGEGERLIHLAALGSPSECNEEIDRFIEEAHFDEDSIGKRYAESDSMQQEEACMSDAQSTLLGPYGGKPAILKETIRNYLCMAAAASPVYKNAIIAFIAWSRRSQLPGYELVARHFLEPSSIISFSAFADGSDAGNNTINLDLSGISFFNGTDANISPQSESFYASRLSSLMHEIGHVLLQIPSTDKNEQQTSTAMEIFSDSIYAIERTHIRRILAFLNSLTSQQFHEAMEVLSDEKECINPSLNREEQMKYIEDILTNRPSLIAGMDDDYELLQIAGLMSHQHDNHAVLYINLLSDMAASISMGRPIRVDHQGIDINKQTKSDEPYSSGHKLCEIIASASSTRINPNFYRAMLSFYGVTPKEYARRCHQHDPYANMLIIPASSLSNALILENRLWRQNNRCIMLQRFSTQHFHLPEAHTKARVEGIAVKEEGRPDIEQAD